MPQPMKINTFSRYYNSLKEFPHSYTYTEYTPPLFIQRNRQSKKPNEKTTEENKLRSLRRARSKLFDLVEAQTSPHLPIFITLTFHNPTNNYEISFRRLRLFLKNLRKHHTPLYIFIPELHQSGNYHFHGILWDSYKPLNHWKQLYPYGDINLQLLTDINSISAYLTKYLTKSTFDHIPDRKPFYIPSRNLNRPQVIYNTNFTINQSMIQYTSISQSKKIYKICKSKPKHS
jgi:hypothetical protein